MSGEEQKQRHGEDEQQRRNREVIELLNELRVALPGVQVLFAFLLIVPFSQGFDGLTNFQKELYFGVLLATALTTALLIGPTAHHRLLFRMRDKEHLVRVSNRMTLAGLAVLALSLTGAVLLISDILFKTAPTIVFTAITGLILVTLWGVVPLLRRRG